MASSLELYRNFVQHTRYRRVWSNYTVIRHDSNSQWARLHIFENR
jgi:hypothetical protein